MLNRVSLLAQVPSDLPPALLVHHVRPPAGEQDHRGAVVLRLRHRHPLRRLHQGQLRPEPVHQRGTDLSTKTIVRLREAWCAGSHNQARPGLYFDIL